MEFLQEFKSKQDIIRNYECDENALDGATIHLAWYGYGSYWGSSLVVFERDGKLYEVNGFHCSCCGLEGQWEPEETSWEALAMRNLYADEYDGGGDAEEALKRLVNQHLAKNPEVI